jgi:type IV pilus assembly protein PilC
MATPTKKKKGAAAFNVNLNFEFGGVNLTQKALFSKNLAMMIKSGITISESLSIIEESLSGKFKKAIVTIRHAVESGGSLSTAMALYPKIFPSLYINTVYAGESSGTLQSNLEYMAEQLRKEKELNSKIMGAMLYPAVVLVAAFFLGLAISFVVLPKVVPLFEGLGVKLPWSTQLLISFSRLMQDHGLAIVIALLVGIAVFIWLIRREFSRPVTHWFLLHIPIIYPLVRSTNIARFCRTLGTLLKSGLTIDEALVVTKDSIGNFYYRKALDDIAARVGSGMKLSDSLKAHRDVFPTLVSRMMNVGEQSGGFEDVLFYLASFYEEEVDNGTKTIATAVEPLLLIFIGSFVGFMAISIITPIYNITGNVGGK